MIPLCDGTENNIEPLTRLEVVQNLHFNSSNQQILQVYVSCLCSSDSAVKNIFVENSGSAGWSRCNTGSDVLKVVNDCITSEGVFWVKLRRRLYASSRSFDGTQEWLPSCSEAS